MAIRRCHMLPMGKRWRRCTAHLQEVEHRVAGTADANVSHQRQVLHQAARLSLRRLCIGAGERGVRP